MKKLVKVFSVTLLLLFLSGCSLFVKFQEPDSDPLQLYPAELTFDATKGNKSVNVAQFISFEENGVKDVLEVKEDASVDGYDEVTLKNEFITAKWYHSNGDKIYISISENTTGVARSYDLIVYGWEGVHSGNYLNQGKQILKITQEAN